MLTSGHCGECRGWGLWGGHVSGILWGVRAWTLYRDWSFVISTNFGLKSWIMDWKAIPCTEKDDAIFFYCRFRATPTKEADGRGSQKWWVKGLHTIAFLKKWIPKQSKFGDSERVLSLLYLQYIRHQLLIANLLQNAQCGAVCPLLANCFINQCARQIALKNGVRILVLSGNLAEGLINFLAIG